MSIDLIKRMVDMLKRLQVGWDGNCPICRVNHLHEFNCPLLALIAEAEAIGLENQDRERKMFQETKTMTLNEYQQKALTTDSYHDAADSYVDLRWAGSDVDGGIAKLLHTIGLVGEAGEVADKIKKNYRDKQGIFSPEEILSIIKEIGDSTWYCAVLANDFGWTLNDVAELNIDKLAIRAQNKTIHGSGDDR